MDGMEITQFTYFQQAGGIDLAPISVELTYGLERIAMYLQGVRSVYDLEWGHGVTYGDLYKLNEAQWSAYNFEVADTDALFAAFDRHERVRPLSGRRPGPPGLRPGAEVQPHLQPAGRPRRDQRHRARRVHLAGTHPRRPGGAGLARAHGPRPGGAACLTSSSRSAARSSRRARAARSSTRRPRCSRPRSRPSGWRASAGRARRRAPALRAHGAGGRRGGGERPARARPVGRGGLRRRRRAHSRGGGLRARAGGGRRGPGDGRGERPALRVRRAPRRGQAGRGSRARARRAPDRGLRFSKTMRWGEGTGLRFSRPVRWIVAKVDERTVPFELHGLVAGDVSQGHRFLGGRPRSAPPPRTRRARGGGRDRGPRSPPRADRLRPRRRGRRGRRGLARPGGVLEEVVFLVEYPNVVFARFDPRHLSLPSRVLVTAMQGHQRYFPLEGPDGALHPRSSPCPTATRPTPAQSRAATRTCSTPACRTPSSASSATASRAWRRSARASTHRLPRPPGHDGRQARPPRGGVGDIAAATKAGDDAAGTAAEAARLAKVDQGAVLVAEFSELEGYAAAQYARLEGVDEAVAKAWRSSTCPRAPSRPCRVRGRRDAGGGGEGRQPRRRVRRGRGPDRLEGPLRPAPGRGRPRADRARPRLDVDPCDLLRPAYDRLAAQGARSRAAGGRGRGGRVPRGPARLPAGRGGRGRRGRRGGHGAGLGGAPRRRRGPGDRGGPRGEDFAAAWTAATRLVRIAARARARGRPTPGADPGEDALHAAVEAARPGIEAARAARDFRRRWRPRRGSGRPWTASSRMSW